MRGVAGSKSILRILPILRGVYCVMGPIFVCNNVCNALRIASIINTMRNQFDFPMYLSYCFVESKKTTSEQMAWDIGIHLYIGVRLTVEGSEPDHEGSIPTPTQNELIILVLPQQFCNKIAL